MAGDAMKRELKLQIHGKPGTRDIGAFCFDCRVELFGEEVRNPDGSQSLINVIGHPQNDCPNSGGFFAVPTMTSECEIVANENVR
jgi:hypothetical protein